MFKAENFERAHHLAFVGISMIIIAFSLFLTACSSGQDGEKWNCTITVPKNSDEIIFCEPVVHSDSGKLCFSNLSDIDVIAFLYESPNIASPVRQTELHAGGSSILYQLTSDTDYRIGIKASASEKRDVTVIVSEYEITDSFTITTS